MYAAPRQRARIKKAAEAPLVLLVQAARLPRFERVYLRFGWAEPNTRRDPDNFCAGGRKVVLDALVRAGVLPGDGWKHVAGWCDEWLVSSEPGVSVTLEAR